MAFRFTRTRRGYPAIRVYGGWEAGKVFGVWVLGRKLKLKEALGHTNLVALDIGDTIFMTKGERIETPLVNLFTQSVRRFNKSGWVVGPETQGMHGREVLPLQIREALKYEATPVNNKRFALLKAITVHKYTATRKTYKERIKA